MRTTATGISMAAVILSLTLGLTAADVTTAVGTWVDLLGQAKTAYAAGHYPEAERLYRATLEQLMPLEKKGPNLAEVWNNLGAQYQVMGRFADAELSYKQALAAWPDSPLYAGGAAKTAMNLAGVYRAQGKVNDAETLYRRTIPRLERAFGPDSTELAIGLANFADMLRAQRRLREAGEYAERAIRIQERATSETDPMLAPKLDIWASILLDSGRVDEAQSALERARSLLEGAADTKLASILNSLGMIATRLGRFSEAESYYRQALAIWREVLGEKHERVAIGLNNLAQAVRLQ